MAHTCRDRRPRWAGNELDNKLVGNAGANVLRGAAGQNTVQGQSGADLLIGGSGNDRIVGGPGADRLSGGPGADVFVFSSVIDSRPVSAASDSILDFVRGQDVIDLGLLEARPNQRGNQAFVMDTDGVFSVGEVRQRAERSGLRLEMNLDPDLDPEMTIVLTGYLGALLRAGDLIL